MNFCTSCGEEYNFSNLDQPHRHEDLSVLVCEDCYSLLQDADRFTPGEDGTEEACRWCGYGGELICCDVCSKAYCRECILRNLGIAGLLTILDSGDDAQNNDEEWHCFVCNPSPIRVLQQYCAYVMGRRDVEREKRGQKRSTSARSSENEDNRPSAKRRQQGEQVSEQTAQAGDQRGTDGDNLFSAEAESSRINTNRLSFAKRIKTELSDNREESVPLCSSTEELVASSPTERFLHRVSQTLSVRRASNGEADASNCVFSSVNEDHGPQLDESNDEQSPQKISSEGLKKTHRPDTLRVRLQRLPLDELRKQSGLVSSACYVDDNLDKNPLLESLAGSSTPGDTKGIKTEPSSLSKANTDIGSSRRKQQRPVKYEVTKSVSEQSSVDSSDSLPSNAFIEPNTSGKHERSHMQDEAKAGPSRHSSRRRGTKRKNPRSSRRRRQETVEASDETVSVTLIVSNDSDEMEEDGEECPVRRHKRKHVHVKGDHDNEESGHSERKPTVTQGAVTPSSSTSDCDDLRGNVQARRAASRQANKKAGSLSDDSDTAVILSKHMGKTSQPQGEDKRKKEAQRKTANHRHDKMTSSSDESDSLVILPKPRTGKKKTKRTGRKKGKQTKQDKLPSARRLLWDSSDSLSDEESDSDKSLEETSSCGESVLVMLNSDGSSQESISESDGSSSLFASSSDEVIVIKRATKRGSRLQNLSPSVDDDRKGKRPRGRQGQGRGKGRVRHHQELISDESEESEDDKEKEDEPSAAGGHGRRAIKKIMDDSRLKKETQRAQKEERERLERLKKRAESMPSANRRDGDVEQIVLEFDPETKKARIEVSEYLCCALKPHQVEGVKFLWNACVESSSCVKEGKWGAGAILAHCMGLGKTLQVITLIDVLMHPRYKDLLDVRRVLILAPVNALCQWEVEMKKWIPEDYLHEVYNYASFSTHGLNSKVEQFNEWFQYGGILLMNYEAFRNLTNSKSIKRKLLQESLFQALVDPGPQVVVCDEGHVLRNISSELSKAVRKMKTLCRIVLTGTPLQNSLKEYHCMVDFVKPNFLGTSREFNNRFVNPITNGQCADSTEYDVRLMKQRSHVLHKLLDGTVHRRDFSCLLPYLPPKKEFIISVRMSPLQCCLYRAYLKLAVGDLESVAEIVHNVFRCFQMLMGVWTHPWALRYRQDQRDAAEEKKRDLAFIDDETGDEEEVITTVGSDKDDDDVVITKKTKVERTDSGCESESGKSDKSLKSSNADQNKENWFEDMLQDGDEEVLEHSGKMVLLLSILEMSSKLEEKVLVFSQSLVSLELIEYFLTQERYGDWAFGLDYYRLDGRTRPETRQAYAERFNNPQNKRCRLFLISTKAGGLGINLIGASRVIIFDASWNPSHDTQSLFRVLRFGQQKPVYVYRFVAQGTMEEKIYDRQVTKQSLSLRVIDEQQIVRHFSFSQIRELFMFTPDILEETQSTDTGKGGDGDLNSNDKSEEKEKEKSTDEGKSSDSAVKSSKDEKSNTGGLASLPQITQTEDPLLTMLLEEEKPRWIVCVHEHNSLLEDQVHDHLTDAEKDEAWTQYQAGMSFVQEMRERQLNMLRQQQQEQIEQRRQQQQQQMERILPPPPEQTAQILLAQHIQAQLGGRSFHQLSASEQQLVRQMSQQYPVQRRHQQVAQPLQQPVLQRVPVEQQGMQRAPVHLYPKYPTPPVPNQGRPPAPANPFSHMMPNATRPPSLPVLRPVDLDQVTMADVMRPPLFPLLRRLDQMPTPGPVTRALAPLVGQQTPQLQAVRPVASQPASQ